MIRRWWTPFLLVLLLLSPVPCQAQKTDTLWLRNGDRLVGEIKRLSRALLKYSTDDLGTVSVEWDKVDRLVSPASFEIEDLIGRRWIGHLVPSSSGLVGVAGPAGTVTLPINAVVEIVPLKAGLLQRLSGYVDLGFTYQRANSTLQLTGGGQVRYRGPSAETVLQVSTFFQDQEEVDGTSRFSSSLVQRVFFGRRWSPGGAVVLEQNEELNLAVRGTLTGFIEKGLVQSNVVEFRAGAGLVLTRERYYDVDTTKTGFEGTVQAEFAAFRYDRPKLDALLGVKAFPSISDFGRVRINTDARLSYELVADFFLTLSVFDQFDSRPPSETAARNDFGTTLSISWSF